jgi:ribosomal protein S18 acetylase RimI-like enzyme
MTTVTLLSQVEVAVHGREDEDAHMEARIRLAGPNDAAALLDLQLVLDQDSKFMLLEPGERQSDLPKLSYRVVATDGDFLAGYVEVSVLPYARTQRRGYIVMGVRASHSRQGLGRALLETAISQARDRGLRRVELTTMTGNQAALSLYLSCGFQVEGLRRAALQIDGIDVDEYYMGLLL